MLHDVFYRFPKTFPLPMLLDGATGTALMREGMPRGCCTEKWVLEHNDVLAEIQKKYFAAGSDAVYAPTFGANRVALARHSLDGDVIRINNMLMAASSEICGDKLVAADMSPTGCFIEPWGDAPLDEVAAVYAEQAGAVCESADFFIIETSISLAEVRAAVIGIKSVSEKPIFVTMTVDERGRTLSGDTLTACLITLADMGISAFGANCSSGPDKMISALAPLVSYGVAYGIPIIAKPNAGMPCENADGTQSFSMTAHDFAFYAKKMLDAGIFVLGGCCGTSDGHIAALREVIDAYDCSEFSVKAADVSRLACTNSSVVTVDIENDLCQCVRVSDVEDFDLVNEDGEFIYLHIDSAEDVEKLRDEMIGITRPLAVCGNRAAIELLCHIWCGKIYIVE